MKNKLMIVVGSLFVSALVAMEQPQLKRKAAAPIELEQAAKAQMVLNITLFQAVASNDADQTRRLLNAGADPDGATQFGCTALLFASAKGFNEIVPLLLKAQARIDTRLPDGSTALMLASKNGHTNIVSALIEEIIFRFGEIDPSSPIATAMKTLLHAGRFSLESTFTDNVRVKRVIRAHLDANESQGLTALMLASTGGHKDIVKMLLDAGADNSLVPKPTKSMKKRTIDDAASQEVSFAQNKKHTTGTTDLHIAAMFSKYKTINQLLVENADFLKRDNKRKFFTDYLPSLAPEVKTMLSSILAYKRILSVPLTGILEKPQDDGTEVAEDETEATALEEPADNFYVTQADLNKQLLRAVSWQKPWPTIKKWIQKGAQVNCVGKDGMTPLMQAAQNGDKRAALILIKSHANINAKGRNEWTALMHAIAANQPVLVHFLLDKGACIFDKDLPGYSAAQMADENLTWIKNLLDGKAPARNEYENKALQFLRSNEDVKTMAKLLAR